MLLLSLFFQKPSLCQCRALSLNIEKFNRRNIIAVIYITSVGEIKPDNRIGTGLELMTLRSTGAAF